MRVLAHGTMKTTIAASLARGIAAWALLAACAAADDSPGSISQRQQTTDRAGAIGVAIPPCLVSTAQGALTPEPPPPSTWAPPGPPPPSPTPCPPTPTQAPTQLPSQPDRPLSTPRLPPTPSGPPQPAYTGPIQPAPLGPSPTGPSAPPRPLDLVGLQRFVDDPGTRGLLRLRVTSHVGRWRGRVIVTDYATTVLETLAGRGGPAYRAQSPLTLRALGGTAVAATGRDAGRGLTMGSEHQPGPVADGSEVLVVVHGYHLPDDLGGNGPDRVVATMESDLVRVDGAEVSWEGGSAPLAALRRSLSAPPTGPRPSSSR